MADEGGKMKMLKLAGLGVVIWGLSLIWPQANQLLTSWVMIGLALGLGAVAVIYVLLRWLDHRHEGDGTSQDHPTHPRPITVAQ
jgi:hypothetical protein